MQNTNIFTRIIEFATKVGLSTWDWFAVICSIAALVVAYCTLRSQRQTERNTTPTVTMGIQEMLWIFLIKQFFYKIQYLHILQVYLQRCNYTKKPEESFIQSFCIAPDNYLHEELFYNQDYEKYFGIVHWIKKHLNDYNMYLEAIARHLEQKNIKPENIERIFDLLDELCYSSMKHYEGIFNGNIENILGEQLFAKQRSVCEKTEIAYGEILQEGERYSRDDAFFNYFNGRIKESYYDIANKYIEYLMIEKNKRFVLVEY